MPRPRRQAASRSAASKARAAARKSPTAQARSASSSRSRCRKLSGASAARAASQPRHLVQLGQQLAALVTMAGAGLPGEGQPAQQAGHGARVEAGGERQQRHRRRGVPRQADRIIEDGGGDRAGDVHDEAGQRIDGCVGEDPLTRCGGAFAAQHSRPATGSCRATGRSARRRYAGRRPAPPPPRRRSRPATARSPASSTGVCGRCSRRRPGRPPAISPCPGSLNRADNVFDRLEPAGQQSEPDSAPVRSRARSRGPRPAPRSAASPGTRRRGRRAAPQRRRRRHRPGRVKVRPRPCSSQIRNASRPSHAYIERSATK